MTRRFLAMLIWLVSTASEGALHWGVETWLDSRQLRDSVASEPLRRTAGMVSEPPPAPTPVPTPTPTPTPPPPDGWDRGRAGSMDLFVLTQEKRWKLKKAEVLDANGKDIEDMESELRRLAPQLRMGYGELVAVGTASCEGLAVLEGRRAENRADMLVDWLRKVFPEDRQIYRLNLGRFRDCHGLSPSQTDNQRRVIVLAIRKKDHGLNREELEKRLLQDLATYRPLGFDPSDYSEFTLLPSK